MFRVNDDKSIYLTRGDAATITLSANTGDGKYQFRHGDVVRFSVLEKKACHCVALRKDFHITEASDTVDIVLTGEDTKLGEIISKPKDYWYEVELNPDSLPQTIIGYDDDGQKVFRLFPEGGEMA